MTKCAVSFGELISFLSMAEEYSGQRVLARCQSNDAAGLTCESHYRGGLFLYSPINTRLSGVCERLGCSTRNSRNPAFRMAAATSCVKLLAARSQAFRIVGRNPRPTHGATETLAADLTDKDQTIRAVAGSSVVHLLVGLNYDHKVW
jgi:hypothetical protein